MPANALDLHPKPTLPASTPLQGASNKKTATATATATSQEHPKKKKTYISKESRVYAYMR